MKTILHFVIYSLIAGLVILLAIVLGDYGTWYFAWLLGTVMLVLISAAGGALLDSQEEHEEASQQGD